MKTNTNKAKIFLIFLGISIFFLVLYLRVFQIQVLERKKLQRIMEDMTRWTQTVEQARGTIFDRRGRRVAVSLPAYSLYANPSRLKSSPKKLLEQLNAIFPISNKKTILKRLSSPNRQFVWIKRKLTEEEKNQVKKLKRKELGFIREYKRHYPLEELGANIVGFVGIDQTGLSGIEYEYDKQLRTKKTKFEVKRDALGRAIQTGGEFVIAPYEGDDLILNADWGIQLIVEEELHATVDHFHAKGGSVILMEPMSGEVIALADAHSFDPNHFSKYSKNALKNQAIQRIFEPGSTFKIVTAAAALSGSDMTENTLFNCPGYFKLYGKKIRCYKAHGTIPFKKVIAYSCNVGSIKAALKVSKKYQMKTIKSFGFGNYSGIDLPGEERGILRDVKHWSGFSQASLAIGQEISVNLSQLVCSVSVIANGGKRMTPRVAKGTMRDHKIQTFKIPSGENTISPELARRIRKLLLAVVDHGTGRAANIPSFLVAGKTGTAQKASSRGGYAKGKFSAVFVGWVEKTPLQPLFSMAIQIDEPDPKKGYYGGLVAAPLFRRISSRVLKYLKVYPDQGFQASQPPIKEIKKSVLPEPEILRRRRVRVPNLKKLSLRDITELQKTFPLDFRVRGRGFVASQDPGPGTIRKFNSIVRVRLTLPSWSKELY